MKPVNEADWLSRFNINITSSSNRIFNNGNHQLEVSVGLTPRNGQTVTQEQLDSIQLVTLEDDGRYQELSGEYGYADERDKRFEYYADTGSMPSALLESTTYRKKFYITSIASGGSRKAIYAAITRAPDEHYVSHTSIFNSSVTIETNTKLRRQRSDFKLEAVDLLQDTVTDTYRWHDSTFEARTSVDVDLYYLEFKNPAFRIVDVRVPFFSGSGCFYSDFNDDTQLAEEIGWPTAPLPRIYKRHAHFLVDPRAADSTFIYRHIRVATNTRDGALNFIRLKLRGAGAVLGEAYRAPRIFGVFDQYGHEHLIEMTQEQDGNLINFTMYDGRLVDFELYGIPTE
ncbi:hypothetical protein [Pseudomonas sp. NPDC090201]|uniref:hypothetical protein n=1 Tax=Pseudomonas sp. NPDC090201 TaxID=3364475 RepID=UPI00380FDB58